MGLSPQYYDECTDDVLNLYAELEDRIIADVVRRIVKTGDITETAKWQIRQAQQMGLLYDDIIKDVAQYTSKTDSEVKKMFENAGVETVNNDNRIHLLAGNSPLDIRQSESMLQILNAVYKERLTDLKNLTGTTAITSQTAYYNACNSAFMMVSSGAFSYQQALRTVIQEVAENGTTVTYPSGHVDRLDVAVRRSLLTGIGLASRQISEENSRLCGCDLMEISAHSGARPSHAAWQGQLVSLSGRKGYLTKDDIGFGTGEGFGGYNCRHDWFPYYEGVSVRNYNKSELAKLNAKDFEYKGKKYTEYEISQMLRRKEREIRACKREKIAYKTVIAETTDKQLKAVFKSALTYTNSAIRDKSAEIKQFCADTGYLRDRFREQIGGKTSVGHGFGGLSKQNQKFNLKSGLTSTQNNGILKDIITDVEINSKYYKGKAALFELTEERINKTPKIIINSLSAELNEKLYNAQIELLKSVAEEELGIEYAYTFNMNMKQINFAKGTSNKHTVTVQREFKDCIVIHNHPDNLPFSPKDFETFAFRSEIRILGAVGHNGNVYYLEKTDEFDEYQFDFDYYNLQKKHGWFDEKGKYHFYSNDDIFELIDEVFAGGEANGFRTYIRTN